MRDHPPVSDELLDEMHRLVTASLGGNLSPAEGQRLEQLIQQDLDACDLYLNLVHEWSMMLTWAGHDRPADTAIREETARRVEETPRRGCDKMGTGTSPDAEFARSARAGSEPVPIFSQPRSEESREASGGCFVEEARPDVDERPIAVPAFVFGGNETCGGVGLLASGWPVAYLAATVIFGIGLVVGALTHVSQPGSSVVSGQWSVVSRSNPQSLIPNPSTAVGRITGMEDCQWEGSGVGGQGAGFRVQKSALSTNHYPLFTITTPTAVVTDLGTEFGVEVSEEGATQVHVLQGLVETRGTGPHGNSAMVERLSEGKAVEIGTKGEGIKAVAFTPQSFLRKLPHAVGNAAEDAYIKAVLADRPMGYWPLNEPAGSRKFADRSGHGIHGFAMREVKAGQPGPFAGASRAITLGGRGYIDLGRHDEFAMKNDFTVEAWVWVGAVKRCSKIIAVLGRNGGSTTGWGLSAGRIAYNAEEEARKPVILYFSTFGLEDYFFDQSADRSLANRWSHVAVTFDSTNTAHLHVDGDHCGSVARANPSRDGPAWLMIGCNDVDDLDFWRGRLAHVAVYPRVLSEQQIQNHYQQCNHNRKEADGKQP